MNDLHVTELIYEVVTDRYVDFNNAPSLLIKQPSFTIDLGASKKDEYKAIVKMIDKFSTIKEARVVVECFLRKWELWDDLYGMNGLRFHYAGATTNDNGHEVVMRSSAELKGEGYTIKSSWPQPPQNITSTAEVEILRSHWTSYHKKQELLTPAAYLALTVVEVLASLPPSGPSKTRKVPKKRLNAAKQFNIDLDVLVKLGELTSEKGGKEEGRKSEGLSNPLSPAERDWIIAVFRELIVRLAERAHTGNPPTRQLTMKGLPLI